MIVDIEQKRSAVEVSYVTEKGQIDIVSIPAKFENWVKCEDTDNDRSLDFKNWKGESVKKQPDFKFRDLNLREFLVKKTPKDIQDKIFAYNKPNWYATDIEIDLRTAKGFPEPSEARYPIASIQLTNQKLSTVILIVDDMNRIEGTEEYRQFIEERVNKHFEKSKKSLDLIEKYAEGGKLRYQHAIFKSESEMLNAFFKIQFSSIHAIIGWNWRDFDAPYISNRCKLIGVDQSKGSPVGGMVQRKMALNKFRRSTDDEDENSSRTYYSPKHRLELDYMELVQKFEYSVEKTSLSLDAIAYQAIDILKVEYDGSFLDLFMDRDNFITYSAIDTVILMMVHLQLQTVSSLEMVTYYAKIPLQRGFSTIALGDALFYDEMYSKGFVFCHEDLYADDDSEEENHDFEGGFVVDPRYPYSEWVALVDFKSLYPTCGQSLGCSFDNIIKEGATKEEQRQAAKEGHRISLNGTIYDKDNTGTLKSIWDRLIYERYHFKDIRVHIDNEILPIVEKVLEKAS